MEQEETKCIKILKRKLKPIRNLIFELLIFATDIQWNLVKATWGTPCSKHDSSEIRPKARELVAGFCETDMFCANNSQRRKQESKGHREKKYCSYTPEKVPRDRVLLTQILWNLNKTNKEICCLLLTMLRKTTRGTFINQNKLVD